MDNRQRIIDTYLCKSTKPEHIKSLLEPYDLIYTDIQIKEHTLFTIYCDRNIATQLSRHMILI